MSDVLKKCKVKLARLLKVDFSAIETDNGALQYDGELGIGTDVYILDDVGEMQPAPDGEYKAEDGTVYEVTEGCISDMTEGKPGEAEEKEKMEEAGGANPLPEDGEVSVADYNALVEVVNMLVAEVARLSEASQKGEEAENKIDKQKKEIAELKRDFAKFKKEPAAGVIESGTHSYNFNSGDFKPTGDAKLDKAIRKWRTNH